eukprot:CAMPEP_0178946780 /NCGR_PEP_ID=MMETSP0789-20121207/4474_1 /TAXON_ID=3005 /ORGANISM="Rhizosolenia setigera, Strain CCMP 1694" /LENGTH=756 /DNA_ID=CAMNT_0020626807 /DNA_START=42 /DNA_END=2312 /DNA_ORIENTATION=-
MSNSIILSPNPSPSQRNHEERYLELDPFVEYDSLQKQKSLAKKLEEKSIKDKKSLDNSSSAKETKLKSSVEKSIKDKDNSEISSSAKEVQLKSSVDKSVKDKKSPEDSSSAKEIKLKSPVEKSVKDKNDKKGNKSVKDKNDKNKDDKQNDKKAIDCPECTTHSPSSMIVSSSLPSRSHIPSFNPTISPSINPTRTHSTNPSLSFSNSPSVQSSLQPSLSISPSISNLPTDTIPTFSPSQNPTKVPSLKPSLKPSSIPSTSPSYIPSELPTSSPSKSLYPSIHPSSSPTISVPPTYFPSTTPSITPTFSKILINSVTPESNEENNRLVYASSCFNPNSGGFDLGPKEVVQYSYTIRVRLNSDPVPVISSLEREVQKDIVDVYLDCTSVEESNNNRKGRGRILTTTTKSQRTLLQVSGVEQITSKPVDKIDTNAACRSEFYEIVEGEDCYVVEGGLTFTWSNDDTKNIEENNNSLRNSTLFLLRSRLEDGLYNDIHENMTGTSFRGVVSYREEIGINNDGSGVGVSSIVVEDQRHYTVGGKPITLIGGCIIAFICIAFLSVLFLFGRRKQTSKDTYNKKYVFALEDDEEDDDKNTVVMMMNNNHQESSEKTVASTPEITMTKKKKKEEIADVEIIEYCKPFHGSPGSTTIGSHTLTSCDTWFTSDDRREVDFDSCCESLCRTEEEEEEVENDGPIFISTRTRFSSQSQKSQSSSRSCSSKSTTVIFPISSSSIPYDSESYKAMHNQKREHSFPDSVTL